MRGVKITLFLTFTAIVTAVSLIIGMNLAWENKLPIHETADAVNSFDTNGLLVTLYRVDEGELTPIDENTSVFSDDTVWTPGHTEVVYIALADNDKTAVNYSIGVNFIETATVQNAEGEKVRLSSLIKVGYIEGLNGVNEDLTDAVSSLTESKPLNSNFGTTGIVESGNVRFIAIVVYLPESVGEINGSTVDLGLSVNVSPITNN